MLEDYIYEQGGSVSTTSAKEHFSRWTSIMLNAAINLNKNILAWENGENLILASALQLSDRFVSEFQQKIDDSFINGYTNGYMIAKNARVLLLKHQIKDDVISVYSLAKHLFPENISLQRGRIFYRNMQKSSLRLLILYLCFTRTNLLLAMEK